MSGMKRHRSFQTTGLLLLSAVLLMGISRCGLKNRTPDLTCGDVAVTVLPGTCVELDNPCSASGAWDRLDGFGFEEPQFNPVLNSISLETQKSRSGTTRQLCASATVGPLESEPLDYIYVQPGSFGLGTLFVTTFVMSVTASANPDTIDTGQSSQLDAAVISGGTAPFTFVWSPSAGLSAHNIQNPLASPPFTTTYAVQVIDSIGRRANASVTVNVNSSLAVTATPPVIAPGESSQLSANVVGMVPPVSFEWTPLSSLNDPLAQSPTASPTVNTTYNVTATDANGVVLTGQVTVTVTLTANASASPAAINPGQSSQLKATVQGGEPPYSYAWSPSGSLDSATIFNPMATPTATTTYNVVVSDSSAAFSQSANASVTVTVNAPGVLTACMTPAGGDIFPPYTVSGGCSGGPNPIVQYCWYFNWSGNPLQDMFPDFCDSQPIANIAGEPGLAQDVRLRVEDNTGARAAVVQTFIFQ